MTHWWRIIHTLYSNPAYRKKHFTGNSKKGQLRFSWSYLFNGTSPLHLHQTMFTKSITFLGSKEQNERWIPLADDLHIIGCYVQTELGHGSNVAGLETTATFDQETDEFVIHTPHIRATKFWPGALGKVCTHAVVFARMKIGENDYGP